MIYINIIDIFSDVKVIILGYTTIYCEGGTTEAIPISLPVLTRIFILHPLTPSLRTGVRARR